MNTNQKPSILVFLVVALAPMFWAGNIVLGRGMATQIPPISLAFWRWTVAFLILLPLTWSYVRRDWKTALAGWKILGLLSFFGITCFNTLLYRAVHTTTAINGALIQTTMPAMVIIISLILYKERITRIQAAGVAVCVLGAIVVVLKGQWQALIHVTLVKGDLLMFVAVIIYALYSALLPKRPNMHPLSFLTYTFGIGATGLLPFYLWEITALGTFRLTPSVVGSIGYVAIFPSIAAYFCWNRGVAMIGANRTSLFITLIPVFAAALAIIFLGETLHAFHLSGMMLILLGFVMFNR